MENKEIKLLSEIKEINKNAPAQQGDLLNKLLITENELNISLNKLYEKGLDTILKKIGEEATETVMAAKDGDKDHIVYEIADLWFHSMVLLAQQDLHPDDVLEELARRFGVSGLDEKASRSE